MGGLGTLVVSCDSSGGIGEKYLDKVKVKRRTVGKFLARVALMEVLSVGAKPLCLAATLAVEPNPTGEEILKGIRDELRSAGIGRQVPVLLSTEKNFRVRQTGVGVTAVALARHGSLKVACSEPGDLIVAIGIPYVGRQVLLGERRRSIADVRDLLALLRSRHVHELVPVGSQGILHEAKLLAKDSKLRFQLESDLKEDSRKSAGPATVVLCSIPTKSLDQLKDLVLKPVNVVGRLI